MVKYMARRPKRNQEASYKIKFPLKTDTVQNQYLARCLNVTPVFDQRVNKRKERRKLTVVD